VPVCRVQVKEVMQAKRLLRRLKEMKRLEEELRVMVHRVGAIIIFHPHSPDVVSDRTPLNVRMKWAS
jgi:hypothetical protein